MMSESVTVTVQDGTNAARPGANATTGGKTEPGQSGPIGRLSLNLPYFRTIPGIIKIVQLIFGIICMICGSPAWGAGHWYLTVAVMGFIATTMWIIVYLLSLREALKIPINWIASELLNTALFSVFYFTAFIVELAWANWARYIVAGVFGIFNTLAYAAGAYFLYLEYKNSQQ